MPRALPDPRRLEAFLAVADLGSFARAAERLNTTQPNISNRIHALERDLGGPLFDRDPGGARLTALGEAIAPRARGAIRALEAVLADAERPIAESLRLGVTELIAQSWLRPYLRALKARFPAMSVELRVDRSRDIERALLERALDLALHNAPFERVISGEIALGAVPWRWVAAPALLGRVLAGGSSIQRLAPDVPIVTHRRNSKAHDEIRAHLAAIGRKDARLAPSSDLGACLHMALDGLGVAVVPEPMARPALDDGRLIVVPHDWSPEPLRFAARYDAERASPRVAEAAALAAAFAG